MVATHPVPSGADQHLPESRDPRFPTGKTVPRTRLSSYSLCGFKVYRFVFTSWYTKAQLKEMYIRPVPGQYTSLPRAPPCSSKLTRPYILLLYCCMALTQRFSAESYAFSEGYVFFCGWHRQQIIVTRPWWLSLFKTQYPVMGAFISRRFCYLNWLSSLKTSLISFALWLIISLQSRK